MSSPDRRLGESAGFTLVEILAVLAILALAVGVAMPLLGHSQDSWAQRAATAELRVVLQGAASDAVTQGRSVVFRADSDGGYWLDGRHLRLGDAAAPRRLSVGGSGQISFYPWGGSSGGRIWIEGPQGRREIAIDAVTGRAVYR